MSPMSLDERLVPVTAAPQVVKHDYPNLPGIDACGIWGQPVADSYWADSAMSCPTGARQAQKIFCPGWENASSQLPVRLNMLPQCADIPQSKSGFFGESSEKRRIAVKRILVLALSGMAGMCCSLSGQKLSGVQTPRSVQDGSARLIEHLDPSQKMLIVLGLQPPHLEEEEQFLKELQTKGSPQFHHFLKPAEWNARFAPSVQDEQAVVDWAESQGLIVKVRFPDRMIVDVQAPAATVERAFHVTINRYQLGPRTFLSNDRDPEIAAGLVGIIHSVIGLNNFDRLRPANSLEEPASAASTSDPGETWGASQQSNGVATNSATAVPMTNGAYNPSAIYSSQAYDFAALQALGHCCNPLGNPPVGSPPEASIAILALDLVDLNDIQGFQNQYPYLAYNVQLINIDGTPSCCSGEATMDTEWATAMANSFGSWENTAEVYVYQGAGSDVATFTDIIEHMANDNYARVFNASYGWNEDWVKGSKTNGNGSNALETDHSIFNEMAGEGWTLVSVSHDGGATAACVHQDEVIYPGSDPNIIAVGGTTLTLNSDGTYNSEAGWTGGPQGCANNDGGSGGGFSSYFGVPDYQSQVVPSEMRGIPDIALNSDGVNTPQNFYYGGSLQKGGGTSIAAPEVAGFFAQENAYLLYLGSITGGFLCGTCAPLGPANPTIYAEGARQFAPHYPFYDITSGCNNNDITAMYNLNYYCAGPGYDNVTGWGSANMLQLAWTINAYMLGDFNPPAITFSGPATTTWYNRNQTVSWNVTTGFLGNGVAGLSQAWDSDPGDAYSEPTPGSGNPFYSGPQFPNASSGSLQLGSTSQGCHTANVRAWDNTGHGSGDQTYGPLCYDTLPPLTSAALSPVPNAAGWLKTSATVTLAARDPGSSSGTGSGVAATGFSIDNAACSPTNVTACTLYRGPFAVTTQGQHTVRFASEDNAGNFGAVQRMAVNIDETPPHTSATLTGTKNGSVYVSPVKIVLSAMDNLSGVAKTLYELSGGPVVSYTGPFTVSTLGKHIIIFQSTDRAGNIESPESVSFVVEGTTTTFVVSSLNPSTKGKAVSFTATVKSSGGALSGSVQFKDGLRILGTVGLNTTTHKATFTTSSLTTGTHSITAVYDGSLDFHGSASAVLRQVVNP